MFEITVVETRSVPVRYVVDAGTGEEAMEMAGAGDTVEKEELGDGEVVDRIPDEDTLRRIAARPERTDA